MAVTIRVGQSYKMRLSESTVEVTAHELGASVHYKVVDPPPVGDAPAGIMNMTEPEFLNYAEDIEGPQAEEGKPAGE